MDLDFILSLVAWLDQSVCGELGETVQCHGGWGAGGISVSVSVSADTVLPCRSGSCVCAAEVVAQTFGGPFL